MLWSVITAQTVGLVRYPTTQAPASGSLTVTTQCADNAHVRTGFSRGVAIVVAGLVQLLSVNVTMDIVQSLLAEGRFVELMVRIRVLSPHLKQKPQRSLVFPIQKPHAPQQQVR